MHYVLIYAFDADDSGNVLLIRKAKPEWQAGRLNLVGGKVEPGESMYAAACREFTEETSLPFYGMGRVGTIRSDNSDFDIGVFRCVTSSRDYKIKSEPLEPVNWYSWRTVKHDPALMDNLLTAIPLIREEMRDWFLIHGKDAAGLPICSIEWGGRVCHPLLS